ncbi:MAG: glycine zipper domain-containing protein, partial [Chlamydiales bacterium]
LIALSLVMVVLASCESKAGTGALVGGGGGALVGGLMGGGTGALIGGAVGAVGGAVIGYTLDEHDRAVMQQRSPQTLRKIDQGEQLSLQDVKNMSRNGLKDDTIISQIQATNSSFRLTADQIIDLKKSGVSQKVIDYMIQTGK